ncbi:MAG: endopeptidase La [Mariprofundales bacterium]
MIVHEPDIIEKEASSLPVLAGDNPPSHLTLFPLSNRPLFPGLVVPLIYDGEDYAPIVRHMIHGDEKYVGLILVRDDNAEPTPKNFFRVGVVARLLKAAEVDGERLHLVVECKQRFRIVEFLNQEVPLRAHVRYHQSTNYAENTELRAYTVAIINTIKELLKHNPLHEDEIKLFLSRYQPNEPSILADFAASLTSADRNELQEMLEIFPIFERMKKVLDLLNREINVSRLQNRIRKNIDDRVADQQREFFLREQLEEIKRELGMNEDPIDKEIERLQKRAKKLEFTTEAREKFNEEINKLSMIDTMSPEYGVTRSYLDWLTILPWGKHCRDRYDLNRASRELNRDHAGLDDVKERILEFIAVSGRKKEVGGSIILFVGPPGVGKTSIGRAIASALNRPFYRFSVGGMRDEAEIKGHRRTYIGAMPGKIIQALKQVKVDNPVLMIDEVDKMGSDARGDPSSALLEVLDPEQNKDFLDHYLDVRFNLSRILFLLTANQLDTVPAALLDRAEIIRLPGYITDEKMRIGAKHLWPRLLKKHAFSRKEIGLTSGALAHIIEGYAREPGVRRLEQRMEKILRKTARLHAQGELELPVRVRKADVATYIGKPRFLDQKVDTAIGSSIGLAWTSLGGVTLSIEALIAHNDQRGLKITGQLGKVMQESANIAFSYILSHASRLGVEKDFFKKTFIHVHVPEGAVPKDGPSAGITIATALLSLALNKPPAPTAMTGELTLTGKVLPIGGVREKVLAAKRMHIKKVILPYDNQIDIEELPESVSEGIQIDYAKHFDDVVELLFPQ